MNISDDDLLRIVEEICISMFADIPEDACESVTAEGVRTLTAIVDINGDWNGSVSVRCDRTLADQIAGTMFDLPVEDLTREDVIDALGEFTNMAAGAVKGLIEGEKHLGLPTVGEGLDYIMVVPHTKLLLGVDYPLGGSSVCLSVHELILAN